MTTSNLTFSIWGLFDKRHKLILEKFRDRFKDKFKSPEFPLHLTISSNFKIPKKDLIKKFIIAGKKCDNFFITTQNIHFKKKYFESLFLKVYFNNDLKNNKEIIDKILIPHKKKYLPHISLFYCDSTNYYKNKIFSKNKRYKKKIKVDKLCLVQNDEKNLKWKVIKQIKI